MSRKQKPTWGSQQLKAAEYGHAALNRVGAVGAYVVNIFTGSSSPSYHQITWESQPFPKLPYSEERLTQIPGNPNVKRFTPARGWRSAAVIAVSIDELTDVRPSNEAELAVAYLDEKVAHVGILPPDVRLGFIGDERHVGAAFRKAGGILRPLVGWSEEGVLTVPKTPTYVINSSVHIDHIATRYPGVPMF